MKNKFRFVTTALVLVLLMLLAVACGGTEAEKETPMPEAKEGYLQVVNATDMVLTSLQLKQEGEGFGLNMLDEDVAAHESVAVKLFGGKAEGEEATFTVRVTLVAPATEKEEEVVVTYECENMTLTKCTHLKVLTETAEGISK